ncbi:hypothetical protein [Clostridium sp. DJ247]|uniref:hypothetical protein n=1 Tax=Clostridium sp. DJ247 TaxID=2726188 RepID=UPI00162AB920|nr:hypothetical protein [Clostridium sp. DJ247]MBC2581923.1 hypothetical protein [Clostridium sp. DJ247]
MFKDKIGEIIQLSSGSNKLSQALPIGGTKNRIELVIKDSNDNLIKSFEFTGDDMIEAQKFYEAYLLSKH